ncbi:uncharacterized protein PITG_18531 [Phytophthora infestans T30-4]|uniref:Uncharacterized protein n=1 Tax=Phytophthora infestans (strain T30-4) TaxID=403677 RepID=D0NY97_PHYIT|nr:uncharacterized protein PITG_18531 [Phytophthora infestans T30-4]EEY68086.1 hypothetical protein PITG_18531 [Phytophthora infestans T30-4]|eukprot:XP_002997644.1 hypothetical protein PITG_18531 [Phytophthora infestans T30-4]
MGKVILLRFKPYEPNFIPTFTFKITSRLRPQHPHVLQSSPPHLVREGSHPQVGCSLT